MSSLPSASRPPLPPDRAEQAILLLEHATTYAIYTMDAESRVVLWNAGAERILGWTETEAVGQTGDVIFTPEDRDAGVPERERATARTEGRAADLRWHVRRDGSRFWADGTLIALYDEPRGEAPRAVRGFAKILRDETVAHEQHLALEALNDALEARVAERTAQVRALAAAVGDAEADVRQQIATVLHDDLQQVLYGLQLGAGALTRTLGARPDLEPEADRVRQMHSWATQALQVTREITLGLVAPVDTQETFAAALTTLAAHTESLYHVAVPVVVGPGADLPDRITRAFVLQTVRELLFNAVKHAGVDTVTIEVAMRDDGVETTVSDAGRGFDPSASRAGMGLRRARQRVDLAGGRLSVESTPGVGTRARLWVPRTEPPL